MAVTVKKIADESGKSRDSVYTFLRKKYDVLYNEDLPKELTEEDLRDFILYQEKKNLGVEESMTKSKAKRKRVKKLTSDEESTLSRILVDLKDSYNKNLQLKSDLECEINTYREQNGSLVMPSGNGSMTMIPQVKQYDQVCNTLMKLSVKVSETEEKLGIFADTEEDKEVYGKEFDD